MLLLCSESVRSLVAAAAACTLQVQKQCATHLPTIAIDQWLPAKSSKARELLLAGCSPAGATAVAKPPVTRGLVFPHTDRFGTPQNVPAGVRVHRCARNHPHALSDISHTMAARRVLSLRGADTSKLLQSLCTNNVATWLDGSSPALAAAFLTTKGRVLADACFWRYDDAVLIDCAAAAAPKLLRHLKMYKLRADVKIRDEADLDVVTATSTLQNCVVSGSDPRTELLGSRGIVEESTEEGEAPGLYLRRRLALGVAEGVELEGAVPLVANLDALNAIAFDKGCYLGQELTARAKFRGQVRRRFMPVALHETDVTHSAARAESPADPVPFAPLSVETPAVGAKLVSNGKDVGKLVAVSPESTAAVADVKLDFALSGEVLDVRVEGSDVRAAPYVPPWWPEDDSES